MILPANIEYRLSGGATNAVGDLSLGGAISSVAAPSTLNALFDRVSSAEAATGDIEYRCVYVRNSHASLTLYSAKAWLSVNTPSPDTVVAVGLGTAAIGAQEQTVANESTAPSGVTFLSPLDFASGLAIGDIPINNYKAIWIRRTVGANAAAYNDSFILDVQGDTPA